eukprot:7050969-Pyramimonas_sp.AAC.1
MSRSQAVRPRELDGLAKCLANQQSALRQYMMEKCDDSTGNINQKEVLRALKHFYPKMPFSAWRCLSLQLNQLDQFVEGKVRALLRGYYVFVTSLLRHYSYIIMLNHLDQFVEGKVRALLRRYYVLVTSLLLHHYARPPRPVRGGQGESVITSLLRPCYVIIT